MYAIVGWTGLIGSTLFRQLLSKGIPPSAISLYNSKNLHAISGAHVNTLFLCCMPATKWWVNLHPDEDLQTLTQIQSILSTVQAEHVVLLSTVDVLLSDKGCSEDSQEWAPHAYGTHRRTLEQFVRQQWMHVSILRLPALFGDGLKKNALYDLLHENQIASISLQAQFQWYNLDNLLTDCMRCLDHRIPLIHLLSQPISMREIVERWFPQWKPECNGTATTLYNLTSSHGEIPKETMLAEMGRWIAWEKFRISHSIAVSNIGFTMTDDIGTHLRNVGITRLEVAPTRGTAFAGFKPVSMQSLLFGTSIRNIFHESQAFLTHLEHLMQSAANKGISTFVFGCPRQRSLTVDIESAIDLFRRVGDLGSLYGITICIEPNAKGYECTWLTNVEEVFAFVQSVAHSNIRISLDTGNYAMEKDATNVSEIPLEWIGHLQISAASLGSSLSPTEYQIASSLLEILWTRGYTGTVSFEARQTEWLAYCNGLRQYMDLLKTTYLRIHSME